MKTKESKNYALPHSALPMPKSPIGTSPPMAMPMPARMPGAELPIPESARNSRSPVAGEMPVIAMGDYPDGRGGMQRVSVTSTPQATQSAERAGTPIGSRPPASRMPM